MGNERNFTYVLLKYFIKITSRLSYVSGFIVVLHMPLYAADEITINRNTTVFTIKTKPYSVHSSLFLQMGNTTSSKNASPFK